MPFSRPTLTELITRMESDLAGRLGLGPLTEKSVLKVLARVEAGGVHLLHGHLDFLAAQVIWDTAEAEYLERWAGIWGMARKPASFAVGTVSVTGTIGSVIPAGSKFQRSDGQEFGTDSSYTLGAGTNSVAITAITAGEAANTVATTELSLTSPISGVGTTATVESPGLGGGAEEETDIELRSRFVSSRQAPPQGGAAADYVAWALEVSGVTRAFALPQHFGAGSVGVTFVTDGLDSPIPDAAKVAEVQAAIDLVRPVTAAVTVFAPTPVTFDPTILVAPWTADVRASVTTELEELLLRESTPGGTLLLSHVQEAISTAPGESDSKVTAPAADVTVQAGELLIMGTINFLEL